MEQSGNRGGEPTGIWQGVIGFIFAFGSMFALPEGLSRLAKATVNPNAEPPPNDVWLTLAGGVALLIGLALIIWCVAIRRHLGRVHDADEKW